MNQHQHHLDPDTELSRCNVCGGAEGSLPTCCPGRQLTTVEADAIYAGQLDFDRGPMGPRPIWWVASSRR